MAAPAAVYRPRYPQATDYYRCVEDYFEPPHADHFHGDPQYSWDDYIEA